jgi:Na+/H+ antiporter NhaD/arsenite permease-like protein
LDGINFSEPIFVFAIMTVASTKPIISTAQSLISGISKKLPAFQLVGTYFLCLTIGPLLGSFITEPAAMTVTALILLSQFYHFQTSEKFKYITLAVLFVNVSIGGVLTNYAAPPVLMVAETWSWSTAFMFKNFGLKSMIAVVINAAGASWILFNEICKIEVESTTQNEKPKNNIPKWVVVIHLIFLGLIVMTSHHPAVCMGALLFFIGITTITQEYQDELKIRQSLLVAFFLAGLVVLGQFQSWWLSPLLQSMEAFPLFLGSAALTAITDNAALTYLGSQVAGVSDSFKYALVAGAVAGGGLTVIANAPNPAGYSILQDSFGSEGIKPGKLFMYALTPTLVAMISFWIF